MQQWKWIYISYLPTYLPNQIIFFKEQNFKTELKQNHRKINCFNFTWNIWLVHSETRKQHLFGLFYLEPNPPASARQANLSLPCCAGLNFMSCGVIDIMIMMIRAVKANSNSLLSAEENFDIKQDRE